MAEPEQFEILIIGSGQGGKLLAWHMAGAGRRTAVVERRWIGGSCPNIACMPSKNVMWSARVAHLAHHAGQFGTVAGPVETDMTAVLQRKRDMVNREIELHLQNYRATGAELIMGKQGFMKILVGADDRILGFTMIGPEAGEVMAAVQMAMLAGLPFQRMRDAVIAHLTMAEGLGPLLSNVPTWVKETER